MEKQIEPVILAIASNLGELGYNYVDSLVLSAFLVSSDEMTAAQVERITWLRQPQVSIAISYLINQKVIIRSSEISMAVGRPVGKYKIRESTSELLDKMRADTLEIASNKMRSIEQVEAILNGNEKIPGDIPDNSS